MKMWIVFLGVLVTVSTVGFAANNPPKQGARPKRPASGGQPKKAYTIEQAISDKAQLNTMAFDGLAFMTGDFCSDTFLPPGKVSDYFGFQYMRDIDENQMGHNTSFLTRIASNVLVTLNDQQKSQFISLGKEQAGQIRELAIKRFPLIQAFRRQLEGNIPAGSKGLDKEAVMQYCAANFELDGLLAYRRAEVVGGIIQTLDEKQKAVLAKLKFGNSQTWPEMNEPIDKRNMAHDVHVAVMTYASEMFSWYAGSVEADTYFCPERHGTYFGGFYMKDMPAMGNRNYSISTSLTGDSGEKFLATLTPAQRKTITDLIDIQRNDINEIVKVRREISTQLRRFIAGQTADKKTVLSLAGRYGELDGQLAYYYATAFAEVYKTLSPEQKQKLMKLRNLDDYPCIGAYVYSERIDSPRIPNTDFLFTASGK